MSSHHPGRIPSLASLARGALDEAYRRRSDALLEDANGLPLPTPNEQWDVELKKNKKSNKKN